MEHPVFATFCEAYQQRSETLRDPLIMGKFFFQYMIENYDDKAVQKNLLKNDGEGLNALRQFRDELMKMTKEEFTGQAAHELIKSFCERMGIGMGKVAQPLRIAVSGSAVTPPIDLTLDILGRDTTLARIDRCLETYAAHA
jgi:glutamyl-tRNA synthetase